MTVFENLKSRNIDELVDWLDKYVSLDAAPWMWWFDRTYCEKCEAEIVYDEKYKLEHEYGWCELNGKCRFFQNMNAVPDNKQTIKMWLESEIE